MVFHEATGLPEELEAEQTEQLGPCHHDLEHQPARQRPIDRGSQPLEVAASGVRQRWFVGAVRKRYQPVGVSVADHCHQRERHARPWHDGVFNPLVARLTRLGISVWGSRVLQVPGRRTGELRSVPVNVLTFEGSRYLVAPRGTTEWVRNVRASGGCRLRVGRRAEDVTLVELPTAAKPEVLRAYLRRWKWEVGQFFDGVGPDAADDELLAIAPGYPVFAIVP